MSAQVGSVDKDGEPRAGFLVYSLLIVWK